MPKSLFLASNDTYSSLEQRALGWEFNLVCFRTSDVCPTRGIVKTLPALPFKNQTCCGSVAKSCATLYDPHWLPHTRFCCLSPFLGVCSNSRSLSWWCHPTISSSVIPFSSCLQSFPTSGSFPMSQFFASGGQRIGVSASASLLPINIQDWFPLECTGWISLQSKGQSRVFSNTTVQKHQFFDAQVSLLSNSHIHTRLLEKP